MDAVADPDVWKRMFPAVYDDGFFDGIENGATNETYYRAMEEYYKAEEIPKYEAEDDILQGMLDEGYTGITHIGGGRYNKADGTRHRVHIVFDAENVKSADAVTYDNAGKVIPLSERFNDQSDDIRWSMKDPNAAPEMTQEQMEQRNRELEGQIYELEMKAEGKQEQAQSTARNMLADGLPHEKIAQYTDLPLAEVEKLAAGQE